MIEFLGAEFGLDRVDAYILCSVAGDLRMHEVVSWRPCDWMGILTFDIRWTCQTMWYVILCRHSDGYMANRYSADWHDDAHVRARIVE